MSGIRFVAGISGYGKVITLAANASYFKMFRILEDRGEDIGYLIKDMDTNDVEILPGNKGVLYIQVYIPAARIFDKVNIVAQLVDLRVGNCEVFDLPDNIRFDMSLLGEMDCITGLLSSNSVTNPDKDDYIAEMHGNRLVVTRIPVPRK